jgi:hypothetical protein
MGMADVIKFQPRQSEWHFQDVDQFLSFAFAGKATFEVVNNQTGSRVVFKFWRPSANYINGPSVWCVTWVDGYNKKLLGQVHSGTPPTFYFDPVPGVQITDLGPRALIGLVTAIRVRDITSHITIYPWAKCCKCGKKTGSQARIYCNKCKR